jgi:hypothetical protein
MFEAVEIDDPVLDATLAAKFGTQPPVPQQMPCRFFGFCRLRRSLRTRWVGMRMRGV